VLEEKRVQEDVEHKERGRNGGGGESDLGFRIGSILIMKAMEGACNDPPNCTWIFRPTKG
jgi:hypothetical protein